MTEPAKLRVPLADLREGEQVLAPEPSRYLCRVRRMAPGDPFVAFDPGARTEADGIMLEPSPRAARVRIGAVRAARLVATTELVLVYALAKGDKTDAVVRDATELGASRVILAQTERAIVKTAGERAESKLARFRRVAEQAARQCGRSDPPAIEGVYPWARALQSAERCEARFCLDPRASQALGPALASASASGASIAFAIGPEGGLSPSEVEAAVVEGFTPASLGRFVLRTETVAAAVLGAVRVLSSG